jgi:glycosyltransferase involved in cell wall biosynthesis
VLHAHQYTPFFYAALARLRSQERVRVIFTEHGRHYPDVVSARRRLVNRFLLSRHAYEIHGVCAFSARALAENDGFGGRPIKVIENGIDPERYMGWADRDELRRRLGLDPTRLYVICVARFHPVKDHATLIDAFARVAASRGDIDLLLAGDGLLRSDLEDRARRLGVASRVHFLGVRSDVPDLLQAADVFALTSLSEAASLTLLEAMASALPVVVTDVGGNPEIVRNEVDGLLVARGDAVGAARALLALLGDPTRARMMGRAGRDRVQDRYRLDRTIANYYQAYRSAAQTLSSRGD